MHLLILFFFAAASASSIKDSVGEGASDKSCPAEYLRFSKEHSGCKTRNPTCEFVKIGIDGDQEIQEILDIHNSLRSKVAMGKEARADGLPQASNMMKMVWDDQLASIAQKWAENCLYDHDCNECRQVENFRVGQNIAQGDGPKKFPFSDMVNSFYKEVENFHKRDLSDFPKNTEKPIGHFTQVIWANTWRVGCGYANYKNGGTIYHFYACNYGPVGNIEGAEIYKPGEPCSACPINSCCGTKCQTGEKIHAGLCSMLNPREAPIFAQKKDGMIFNCDFTDGNKDCATMSSGKKNWIIKQTLTGNVLSIKLKGGEQSQIKLTTPIHPDGKFCLKMEFRKGPAVAGQNDFSKAELIIERKFGPPIESQLRLSQLRFTSFSFSLPKMGAIFVSFKFSVPSDLHEHILDIKDVQAIDGNC